MRVYDEDFYVRTKRATLHSAEEIVPLVVDLVHPKSVVDVGCAAGTWLSVFQRFGVSDFMGADTPYVKTNLMEIPQDAFRTVDLEKPFRLGRTFDLVSSMEVAEHLPKESAEGFVDSLTNLGPVVLFSAAIPFQGGDHHLNEQWPEYWARLFSARGYVAVDCLRQKLWNNSSVAWWYAQNLVLYVRRDYLESHPRLQSEAKGMDQLPALVHPGRYMATADLKAVPLRRLLRALPVALVNGAKRTFRPHSVQW